MQKYYWSCEESSISLTDTVVLFYTFVAVNLGADELMSSLHDVVAEWN